MVFMVPFNNLLPTKLSCVTHVEFHFFFFFYYKYSRLLETVALKGRKKIEAL